MTKPSSLPGLALLLAVCSTLASPAFAQTLVRDRVQALPGRATLAHTVAPRALRAIDLGVAPANTPLQSMTMRFSLTAAQNQALATLEAAQQNPSSALYHQWLTPEQYGAQFGLSSNDLAQVTTWLQGQGFSNIQPARSRSFVTFSGTAAQAGAAFSTSIHSFQADGQNHIGNLTDAVIPAGFASIVSSVTGLDDFRPQSRLKVRTVPAPDANQPRFTSSVSGNTFLAPGDLYTIYNTTPLLNASNNGAGVTIAIMGQTDIALSDIAAFRSAAGLAANVPTIKLYGADPGTQSSDLPEASLDVEWSGAMAPAATILFVNSTNVIDGSLTQTIDNNLAPIISISYGDCEANFSSASAIASYNQLFRQANVQGQTILGPSADTGATDCDYNNTTGIATGGLAVDFPASSPYVTGVGGTEFNEAGGSYFGTTNGNFQGSALSYIPEMVWNDTAANATAGAPGLAAGGGGASAIFVKPSYQVGTGVPNDSSRDVPDLSLTASADHDGYLFCAGGFCTNGFRNATQNLDVVGGTSASTPSFAGIMALLEQKIKSRVGNANPVIYGMANSTYYSTAFHDVTVGSNASACLAGTLNCPNGGSIGYAAGVGYDQATGWGSVNAANFVADWLLVTPAGISTPQSFNTPSVTLALTSVGATAGAPDTLQVNVASATTGLSTVPTGSVQLFLDGTASGSAVRLSGGATTLTVPTTSFGSGAHSISVVYSGDNTYSAAKGALALSIDFSLTPTTSAVTVTRGATSPGVTFTVTPFLGFTGAVTFTASEATGALNGTYQFVPQTVNITSAASANTVFSFTAFVVAAKPGSGLIQLNPTQSRLQGKPEPWKLAGTGLAMAGLGFLFLPRRRRRLGALLAALLTIGMLTVSGCGDNGAPANINSTPGTYNVTITATSGSIVHTSTLKLTIQ